jgi:transposase-like protein
MSFLIHGDIRMGPFTDDLRERIVAAYETGGVSLAAVGRRFGISDKVLWEIRATETLPGNAGSPAASAGPKAGRVGGK